METPEEEAYNLSQIRQGKSRYQTRSMQSIMSELLTRRGYAAEQTHSALDRVWSELAGSAANNSRAGKIRAGALQVTVRDSLTMQELHFRKLELIDGINSALPDYRLRDIKFRVGAIG